MSILCCYNDRLVGKDTYFATNCVCYGCYNRSCDYLLFLHETINEVYNYVIVLLQI